MRSQVVFLRWRATRSKADYPICKNLRYECFDPLKRGTLPLIRCTLPLAGSRPNKTLLGAPTRQGDAEACHGDVSAGELPGRSSSMGSTEVGTFSCASRERGPGFAGPKQNDSIRNE